MATKKFKKNKKTMKTMKKQNSRKKMKGGASEIYADPTKSSSSFYSNQNFITSNKSSKYNTLSNYSRSNEEKKARNARLTPDNIVKKSTLERLHAEEKQRIINSNPEEKKKQNISIARQKRERLKNLAKLPVVAQRLKDGPKMRISQVNSIISSIQSKEKLLTSSQSPPPLPPRRKSSESSSLPSKISFKRPKKH